MKTNSTNNDNLKTECENLVRNLHIEFSEDIQKADQEKKRWYELFVIGNNSIGTHSLEKGKTFKEVTINISNYAEQYGIDKINIDIWERVDNPQIVLDMRQSAKLLNLPKLVDISFQIEAGYIWGRGIKEEKNKSFNNEIIQLFNKAGFEVKLTNPYSDCLTATKGYTSLYCHPMTLSGCCEKSQINEIEAIISKANTFTHTKTEIYQKIYPYSIKQESEYYKLIFGDNIENQLLISFATQSCNDYKSKNDILDLIINELKIETISNKYLFTSESPCYIYVHEIYDKMLAEGLLIEDSESEDDFYWKLCRSITDEELKLQKQ